MASRRSPESEFVGGGRAVGKAETESGSFDIQYRRENFYIASADRHHQKERVRVGSKETLRVPVHVWALVNKWVNDPRTPYRSAQDMDRDSLVHRIHDLEGFAQDSKTGLWRLFTEQEEMQRVADDLERYGDAVIRTREIVAQASQSGNAEFFATAIKQARAVAEALPHPFQEQLTTYVDGQLSVRRLP